MPELEPVLAAVVQALARQVGVPAADIAPDTPLAQVPEIESVKVLRAIAEVEDSYRILIPDDFPFETATVRELAELIAGLVRT
jgi:acyl carrier protein